MTEVNKCHCNNNPWDPRCYVLVHKNYLDSLYSMATQNAKSSPDASEPNSESVQGNPFNWKPYVVADDPFHGVVWMKKAKVSFDNPITHFKPW